MYLTLNGDPNHVQGLLAGQTQLPCYQGTLDDFMFSVVLVQVVDFWFC